MKRQRSTAMLAATALMLATPLSARADVSTRTLTAPFDEATTSRACTPLEQHPICSTSATASVDGSMNAAGNATLAAATVYVTVSARATATGSVISRFSITEPADSVRVGLTFEDIQARAEALGVPTPTAESTLRVKIVHGSCSGCGATRTVTGPAGTLSVVSTLHHPEGEDVPPGLITVEATVEARAHVFMRYTRTPVPVGCTLWICCWPYWFGCLRVDGAWNGAGHAEAELSLRLRSIEVAERR